MGRVHTLPEAVINHIAAGEVIERPASVVKELLENALDAQARSIKVLVQGGGTEIIQVDDDGLGMDPEDAVHCFTRHATSKINTLEDLDQITTLGFRGEALPSIAAVSRLQLISLCQPASLGTRVVFAGGTLLEAEACGAPPGTSIRVSELFYNTPARRKFLKHPATEASHIAHWCTTLALVAPAVHMTLHLNGRLHMQAPPAAGLGERLEMLFGAGFQEQVLQVEDHSADVQVDGYIAKATVHRATRRQQFFFVNGRAVQNRMLSHALYEAYRTILPRDRHPVAYVFLTLPASEVDVNVHPAKLEVRFRQEARLYDRLRRLFQQRLLDSVAAPGVTQPADLQPSAPVPPAIPGGPCQCCGKRRPPRLCRRHRPHGWAALHRLSPRNSTCTPVTQKPGAPFSKAYLWDSSTIPILCCNMPMVCSWLINTRRTSACSMSAYGRMCMTVHSQRNRCCFLPCLISAPLTRNGSLRACPVSLPWALRLSTLGGRRIVSRASLPCWRNATMLRL